MTEKRSQAQQRLRHIFQVCLGYARSQVQRGRRDPAHSAKTSVVDSQGIWGPPRITLGPRVIDGHDDTVNGSLPDLPADNKDVTAIIEAGRTGSATDKARSRPKGCTITGETARPKCSCPHCRAVFDEWGQAALGFQQWLKALSPERRADFFGSKL
jgi:hypothetical protein